MPRSQANIRTPRKTSPARPRPRAKTRPVTERPPLAGRFAACLKALGAPWPAAIAVSGGGDSVALMLLLADWAKTHNHSPPVVITVDHGLQEGSAKIARGVVRRAKEAGLSAHVFSWKGSKPRTGIEIAARVARYRLMGAWCKTNGFTALYLAHNLEDQAETFLLRLARGSGVDGLAAMRAIAPYPLAGFGELALVRPLLGISRSELRDYLRSAGEPWSEDPMNADPRFARVRLRALLPSLEEAGLSAARIAYAASHLGRVRETLDQMADVLLARCTRGGKGHVVLNGAAFAAAPPEVGLRALSRILMGLSGQPYRPRFERLDVLFDAIRTGTLNAARTLHGCVIGPAPRREAVFGPGTLVARPEPGRKGRKV